MRRILICGHSDPEYPRDRTIIKAIRRIDWNRCYDLRFVQSGWMRKGSQGSFQRSLLKRMGIKSKVYEIKRLIRSNKIDVIFVMKLNAPLIRKVKEWIGNRRIPIVYDLWVSRYLMAQRDQKDVRQWYRLEFDVIHSCDHLLALSEPYKHFYTNTYDIHPDRISVAPLVVEDIWLEQACSTRFSDHGKSIVAYWGNFLKQHGIELALKAAKILVEQKDIEFHFFGYGAHTFRKSHIGLGEIPNTRFFDKMRRTESLIRRIDGADLCFGHLLPIHDAHLVLPNKAIEGMARAKVVLHTDSKDLRLKYGNTDQSNPSVAFFKSDAAVLAKVIREFHEFPELRQTTGLSARKKVIMNHSITALTASLRDVLQRDHSDFSER